MSSFRKGAGSYISPPAPVVSHSVFTIAVDVIIVVATIATATVVVVVATRLLLLVVVVTLLLLLRQESIKGGDR